MFIFTGRPESSLAWECIFTFCVVGVVIGVVVCFVGVVVVGVNSPFVSKIWSDEDVVTVVAVAAAVVAVVAVVSFLLSVDLCVMVLSWIWSLPAPVFFHKEYFNSF